ncbi:helix-turn-helix domain-containing protein [Liberiplasma polymorphum]|uniref:helix-turn-helix domain-containing protein n=1 Tax=Liberiplasma polymorphum TaxID=3374570 RepID=UPI003772AEB5
MKNKNSKIGRVMRERVGYTQCHLATLLDKKFSVSSIRNYENGDRDAPVSYLLALSKLYRCTLNDLIDEEKTFYMFSNIDMLNYSYVNHISNIEKPVVKVAYSYDRNIHTDKYTYLYYLLTADDVTLNLPSGTRLLVQMKGKEMIDVNYKERMYLISADKQNHPDFNYEKPFQIDSNSKTTETKQFFTRARLVKDLSNKTVMYYDGEIIRHMNYRNFKSMIDGVVYKYVFDENIDEFTLMQPKDGFILQ